MAFSIEVRFLGGLTKSQEALFEQAAQRWSEVIIGDLPRVNVNGEVINGVLITAQGVFIDGRGGTLGRAATREKPTSAQLCLRPGGRIPACGFMQFDTADLFDLEMAGGFDDVILHEMGHVLGIGSLWSTLGLVRNQFGPNPTFHGPAAMREFATLIGANDPTPVPVANCGRRGSHGLHWRESVFGRALMSPSADLGTLPLTRLTIAALQDQGYDVNLNAADAFSLPSALELAIMGAGAGENVRRRCLCDGKPLNPVVLPEAALVD